MFIGQRPSARFNFHALILPTLRLHRLDFAEERLRLVVHRFVKRVGDGDFAGAGDGHEPRGDVDTVADGTDVGAAERL